MKFGFSLIPIARPTLASIVLTFLGVNLGLLRFKALCLIKKASGLTGYIYFHETFLSSYIYVPQLGVIVSSFFFLLKFSINISLCEVNL